MRGMILATAALALLTAPPDAGAQTAPSQEPLMSAETFAKLKKAALDTKKKITLPPDAKAAFRMGDSIELPECKQLVASGQDKTKYFFMVRTKLDADDVFLGSQTEEGVLHMFFTNSKMNLRNAATAAKNQPLHAVVNPQSSQEEFETLVGTWVALANTMP